MRKPLDKTAVSLMLCLCALWGLQQVAIKVASPSLNPVLQIGVRCSVAVVLLMAYMMLRGERFWRRDRTLWPGLMAGTAFALEFFCVAWGLLYTTASHMVVFMYTMPIFAALGLHWFVPGERLGRLQWVGVFVAFLGIVCAFSSGFFTVADDVASMLIGDFLGIAAGFFWAATTLIIRRTVLSETAPAKTLFYQLAVTAALLVPVGYFVFQEGHVRMVPIAWLSMLYQSVLVGFVSLMFWFWLLRHYLASRVSVFSFMTPLFGVTFGVVLLNDPMDIWFVLGAALVVAGIMLVNWQGVRARR